jgi:hypothetical protein
MRLTIQELTARHRRLNVAWDFARELDVPVPVEELEQAISVLTRGAAQGKV